MKTFFNLFFAAALLVVSAESLYAADLKFNGEYRVRAFMYNDIDAIDQTTKDPSDYFDQRFLLTGTVSQGVTTGLVELALLQSSGAGSNQGGNVWGNTGYTANVTHGGIHQAYLNVTMPMANLMAGRRIIKLGHGLILNDTADNLALRIPLEMVAIDLAYLKLRETDGRNTGNNEDVDQTGMLVNVALKPMDMWSFGLFYVTDTQKKVVTISPVDDSTANVFGISADGMAGPVGIAFEFDSISGKDGTGVTSKDRKGQNLLLAAHGDLGMAKVGIGYLRVKGADKTAIAAGTEVSYNSIAGDFVGGNGVLFNDQTRYGGGIDLNTGAADLKDTTTQLKVLSHNFQAVKLFATAAPMDSVMVGLEIFPLVRLIDSDTAGNDNVGTEVNLTGGYQIDKNLRVNALAAFFSPSDVVKDVAIAAGATDAKAVTKLSAGLTYTF